MASLVERILEIMAGVPVREAVVFLISMLPVLELRGGMLAASYLEIPMIRGILLCVMGCFLPVPFILLLIRRILRLMKRFRLTEQLARKTERHALEKSDQIGKYEFWGLLIFVGIPLPGTGAWTGALVAALLGISMKKALPAIFIGVLISAAMMTAVAYGLLDLLRFW